MSCPSTDRLGPAIPSLVFSASLLAVASIAFTACRSQCASSPYVPPQVEESNVLDRSLVTGEPCSPPCWQGIVPGVSTVDDAIETLLSDRSVDSDSIRRFDWQGHDGWETIDWRSSISDLPFSAGRIRLNGDNVSLVSVTLEYELDLADLVDIYGDPDGYYVVESYTPNGCYSYAVDVVWLEDGLAASVYTTVANQLAEGEQVVAEDHLVVQDVSYYHPTLEAQDYLAASGVTLNTPPSSFTFQEWQSFDAIINP